MTIDVRRVRGIEGSDPSRRFAPFSRLEHESSIEMTGLFARYIGMA